MFITTENIILFAVLLGLLILYPVLMVRRNKKEQEKQKNLINGLKKGEYVITYSGVFGKITEIIEKEVGKFIVIETGETHKTHVTLSENAIYMIVNNNPKVYTAEGDVKAEDYSAKKETIESKTEEKPVEVAEEKKPAKKTAKKSTAKKSKSAK